MPLDKKEVLIGAHISISQGLHRAPAEGRKIGANVIQIFTANQRQWKAKKIEPKEAQLFEEALAENNISHVMSHNSYLINLGSPRKAVLGKSIKAFTEELERCHMLKIPYLTFHPGAALNSSEEICLDTIITSLLEIEKIANQGTTRLLLETTAGQGSNVGYKFDHLGYIISEIGKKIPLGVTIDTCHIFAAGYDIRTEEGWEKTLKEFDEKIGLENLFAFHLNDSMQPLGSKKDRHEMLGKGKIGLECFKFLMRSKKTKHLPKYLETPDPDKWEEEITMLRKFAG